MNERQVKFRAWDGIRMTKSGIMFNTSTGCLEVPTEASFGGELTKKSKYFLMQCTGYKDERGKEIYEGDILDSGGEFGYLGENVFVTWNEEELAWAVSTKEDALRDMLRSCFADKSVVWKIIGNIYANPELLEQK